MVRLLRQKSTSLLLLASSSTTTKTSSFFPTIITKNSKNIVVVPTSSVSRYYSSFIRTSSTQATSGTTRKQRYYSCLTNNQVSVNPYNILLLSTKSSSLQTKRYNMSSSSTPASSSSSSSSSERMMIGNDVIHAMDALWNSDCICFDVDSTVIQEEGIDVLADYLGKGTEVSALTKAAMEGGMKFQDALAARLSLLRPSRTQIFECIERHPFQLTPNMKQLIQTFQTLGKDVHLVSGGFRIMIEPIAKQLNIPKTNIIANTILFDENGTYIGFDMTEPTSQDMGKAKALQQIQDQYNYQCMIMIGDGYTDSQAKPPASAFIGFGGVVVREQVKRASDWFVIDLNDIIHHMKNQNQT